jgi:hypothetical protein
LSPQPAASATATSPAGSSIVIGLIGASNRLD